MILQELVKLYERKASDSRIAPIGLEWKEISFAIIINNEGKFLDIEDLRTGDKKPGGRRCLVPQAIKRTGNVKPQLLWDNVGYVLGFDSIKPERASKEHQSFKRRVEEFLTQCPDATEAVAVQQFLTSDQIQRVYAHKHWNQLMATNGNISFRLQGQEHLVPESPQIHEAIRNHDLPNNQEPQAVCLVTGKKDHLSKPHPLIKGIYGGNTSGVSLVSFNQNSFRSFGKKQGANAPIGTYAATAYTTALNSLLEQGSRQRIQFGDTSVVFWSESCAPFEDLLFDLFGEQMKDDPSARTEAIRNLYFSPKTGVLPFEGEQTRFFVLGLGPNVARACIRFWHVSTVSELAGNIRQYFSDVEVTGPPSIESPPKLMNLLVSTSLRRERKNILPTLPAAMLKSIFDGTPFPWSLPNAIMQRIRASERVDYYRAALLKAFLNRWLRHNGRKEEEMTVSLDQSNNSIGYNLGRLFAVLEKIQEEALGKINAPIREKYYPAASASPVTCFPLLMRMKNHHLAKLENKGRVVNLEKLLTSIFSRITDFPAHLTLTEQGKFAIGYYHQQQAFYEKQDQEKQEIRVK